MSRNKIFILLMLAVFLILGNFTFTFTNNKSERVFRYNGIMWVVLDRISIWTHHSNDKPLKLFEYIKTKV